MPFVIDVDEEAKYVSVGLNASGHGTHVAGIAAGKGYFGGAFDGVAPEAQIVAVKGCLYGGGCTAHALIEGMIYLAEEARVDVINMSIGGLPALNDGNNARAEIYDRLIADSKVQIFLSQGNNGPGVNTSGDPSVTTTAVAVGAYQSAATWAANYDSVVPKAHTMWPFSSRGPREDGGLKPNITAPGSAVAAWPTWNRNTASARSFVLPPGVEMIQGTSMASPHATGGAALILSAMKQNATREGQLKYDPALLRQALNSSSTFIPGYQALDQGNGLMNVPAAWELFRQDDEAHRGERPRPGPHRAGRVPEDAERGHRHLRA
jgi:subtilisin family serine protease